MQSSDICRNLLQIKAIKLSPQNPFTWASGMRSPIYCDNRIALSYPKVRTGIKESFAAIAQKLEPFDMISGVATAGIAHGALLADYMDKPFSYVRAEAKSHGRQNQIEGDIQPGMKVLVIEDLISTGGSSLQAIEILRQNTVTVVAALAIFDYGFALAKDNFSKNNVTYSSLANYNDLITEALDSKYITDEEANVLAVWNRNPMDWYDNNFKQE